MMRVPGARRGLPGLVILALTGCVSGPLVRSPTPASPPAQPSSEQPPAVHVVQRGDTLYDIAFRYGLDYRDLARWNQIANPDRIFVGQQVRLSPPAGSASSTAGSTAGASRPASSSSAGRAASAPPAPSAPLPAPPQLPPPAWEWPTDGGVVSAFGARSGGISSGVGIGGQAGQPVRAAASGRVVYAGAGLIGYGQLIIIMHNDTYLTAYGHNARLLVGQGENVERGQPIAEMGMGPGREPRLHFEIRRNGTPVDPMQYLRAAR